MHKDKFLYFFEDFDIEIPELQNNEKKELASFVEKTRHFIEIAELYKIFRSNLNLLLSHFELKTNDEIIYYQKKLDEDELYTFRLSLYQNELKLVRPLP